jgi:ABC-type protease/lipase transport system fused ATPase/permease subunit
MPTSRKPLQQVRRAILAAFVLGGFACLLQLTLPIYALHAFESAIPAAGRETLVLLALMAAGTAALWTCVAAARDRILLRAGLWLDHTLGRSLLEEGERIGTPPAELEKDVDALAVFARALARRAVVPALDAPWLALFVVALALLHPMMGAVAAACAALLLGVSLVQAGPLGRLAQEVAEARKGNATWWLAASLSPSLPPAAANEWAQLDRAHIAGAYELGTRSALLHDASRLLRAGAQVALVTAGAWLVIGHELTLAALFACVLINASLLALLERLIGSLPRLHGAMTACRRLAVLPDRAPSEREMALLSATAAAPHRTVPRLNVRGPLALGLAAIVLFFVAASGAALTRLGDLAALAGGAMFETRLTAVASPKSGIAARVHVRKGAHVQVGDLIITLDTAALDRHITALKAQAQTAKQQLSLIRQEASGLVQPAEDQTADLPTVASLGQRTGELEQEAQWLLARIAAAEEELARSEVRAPVSGRVMARGAQAPTAPGMILLEIATNDRPLLDRLLEPLLRGVQRRRTPGLQLAEPRE